jgi:hypothetical protein
MCTAFGALRKVFYSAASFIRETTSIMKQLIWRITATVLGIGTTFASIPSAEAGPIQWTDWTTNASSGPGFVGLGTITTSSTTVNVTYTNPIGISFFQTGAGGETDYWINGNTGNRTPVSTSPYTSAIVDNIPTGTDMIALQFAGSQTLSFSEAIANPVFSYVSLNGNGYAFLNQDFDILSFGDGDLISGNSPGYWGPGTSFKNVVDLGGGNFEYQLLGTGEPHGTIRFTGAFSSVTWRSLSNEGWNGFTVGVEGTAREVFGNGVPEPSSIVIFLGMGLFAMVLNGKRRKQATATA